MKTIIVTLKQVRECPTHNLSVEHWLPEHKVEQCDPILTRKFKSLKLKHRLKKKIALRKLTKKYEEDLIALRHSKEE